MITRPVKLTEPPNQTITRWECNKCRDTWCQRFTVKSGAPEIRLKKLLGQYMILGAADRKEAYRLCAVPEEEE